MQNIIIGSIAGVIGLVLLALGWRGSRRSGMYGLYVEATRTSEIADGVPAFFGGTVAVAQPIKTPYSQLPCVYYSYSVEELTETRDADGTVRQEWQTITSNSSSTPFWLQSTGGQVMVNPQSADIQGAQSTENLIQPGDVEGVGKLGSLINMVNRMAGANRRVREQYIPVGSQLNVGGVATEQNGQKVFANDHHYPLVLTPSSKQQLLERSHTANLLLYGFGVLFLVGAVCAVLFIHTKK